MYSRSSRRETKVGMPQLKISHDCLQFTFTFRRRRHHIALGLPNTPLDRKLAQETASQIQRDIKYEEFDPSSEKYKIQSELTTVEPVSELPVTALKLPELWARYSDTRKFGKSSATIRMLVGSLNI